MSNLLEQPSSICLEYDRCLAFACTSRLQLWGMQHLLPSQCVLASEHASTVVALVVPLLHMNTLMMPLEIRLAHKLFGTAINLAWEMVLAPFVVRLHVRLEVVAAAEELPTAPDFALKIGFFLGRELSWCPP